MESFTLKEVALATGGKVSSSFENTVVESVSTDSREIKEGALFVPIKGENFDGHDFIEDCIKARKNIDRKVNVKESTEFLKKTPFLNTDINQLKIIRHQFLENNPQVRLKKRDVDDKKSFHFHQRLFR